MRQQVVRLQREAGEYSEEVGQFKEETATQEGEFECRHEAELWYEQSCSAHERFQTEVGHFNKANRYVTEFAAEANWYIEEIVGQMQES